jgi:hypothetical protein
MFPTGRAAPESAPKKIDEFAVFVCDTFLFWPEKGGCLFEEPGRGSPGERGGAFLGDLGKDKRKNTSIAMSNVTTVPVEELQLPTETFVAFAVFSAASLGMVFFELLFFFFLVLFFFEIIFSSIFTADVSSIRKLEEDLPVCHCRRHSGS